MSSPVSSIPNLGPASEAAFAKAGVHSAEEIREMEKRFLELMKGVLA